MLRLQDLVNKLFEPEQWPVHFWLDTLCVPLQYPLRRIAINSMRSIYEGARKVLVIDSILGQISVQETDVVELAMRVRVSTWGRRLWTFHEGRLAQQLYYQYQDEALTLIDLRNMALERQFREDEEWHRLCDDKWNLALADNEDPMDLFGIYYRKLSMNPIEREALSWMKSQEGHLSIVSGPFFRRLSDLTNSLRYRWTSWLEDETICLSGLLGLEVEQVTSIATSDSATTQECRMQQFLGSLDEVPADILFSPRPRLKQKGSRWMPNSFLGSPLHTYVGGFEKGTPTNEGLLVHLPGMLLPRLGPKRPLESIYFAYGEEFLKIILNDTTEFEWDEFCERSSAVIFRYPLNITDSPAPGMISMETEGLWVTFENDHHQSDDDCIAVKYGHHVSVETSNDLPLGTQYLWVFAKSCGPRQCWCVG